MLTRGFKLFFGFALAAFFGALTFGFASGDTAGPDYLGVLDRGAFKGIISLGWQGSVGEPIGYITLIILASVFAFLAFTLVAFRDADPESVAQLSPNGELPQGQAPLGQTWWPMAAAAGVGTLIVGLATSKIVWFLGLVILAVVVFEWMMEAWADRATGDPETNKQLRRTIMGPVEIPVLSFGLILITALAVSRIFLTVSEAWAVWVAMIIAVLILAVGTMAALKPELGKFAIGGAVGLLVVGVLGAGIVSAAIGEREIELHHGDHGEEHGGDHGEDHSEDEVGLGTMEIVISRTTGEIVE